MIHFDLPKEKSSILKVIGVGGGGSNAVNHMSDMGIEGVNFIICNTDAQAITQSKINNKVQLGPLLTQGLGAGANPDIGALATEESLDEIKKILEVNTKMAFITAGMGGGTGTGGAPIVAQICKDMNILTVGIVTTPFAHEGKKRLAQAEAGIAKMKEHVDTLIVISNEKLRHQYGNLKVKEAFGKADDVVATAAKCITDVINTTGQINVDFADVCTVMRNGGVAILGSGIASGNDRAQVAIQQALNSPLLNDNDIRGAKWILININSAEGDHEFTMDEVDVINEYLVSQAGEDADVIMGLGYDQTLDKNIGVTIIATGFEHKDPFKKEAIPVVDKTIKFALQPEVVVQAVTKDIEVVKEPEIVFAKQDESLMPTLQINDANNFVAEVTTTSKPLELKLDFDVEEETIIPASLQKPSNLFADYTSKIILDDKDEEMKPEEQNNFQLTLKDNVSSITSQTEDINYLDNQEKQNKIISAVSPKEHEDFEKRVNERINKLRSLSFNLNTSDPNNEFEVVPAYQRKNENIDLNTNVDQFYSSYTVKKNENDKTEISGLNSFLSGDKPD